MGLSPLAKIRMDVREPQAEFLKKPLYVCLDEFLSRQCELIFYHAIYISMKYEFT